MSEMGLRPEWEKENNRTQIIFSLIDKPLSFTELLDNTGLARSTISNHLKELQKDNVITKALLNGRVVYRITFSEDILEEEIIKANFDVILNLIFKTNPIIGLFIKSMIKSNVKTVTIINKRILEGKPPLSENELSEEVAKAVADDLEKENLDPDVYKKFAEVMKSTGRLISLRANSRGLRNESI